jgi:hypothetical protein
MNEVEIRDRLRQAVGDIPYPAGLSSRVEARLKYSTLDDLGTRTGRKQSPRLVNLGRAGSLVAALLVVLLMASLVLAVDLWLVNTRPVAPAVPVGQDPSSIKQYQSMVSVDLQRLDDAPAYSCTSFDDPNCLPETALTASALQQWLDDLESSQPPARFAVLDRLMRQDLAFAISDQNAFVTAYKARDPNSLNTGAGTGWVSRTLARDIIASSQGTIVQYTAQVRLDRTYLLACALCQRLVSQNQVSCPPSQTPSCVDEIAAVKEQVVIFLEDLVRLFAPDTLAAKDSRLQTDLVTADRELDAMEAALSAGDQVARQSHHDALRQAINRVESDATSIAGST